MNANGNKSEGVQNDSVIMSRIVCFSNGAFYANNKQIIAPFVNAYHACVVWCALILSPFENTDNDKDVAVIDKGNRSANTVNCLRVISVPAYLNSTEL